MKQFYRILLFMLCVASTFQGFAYDFEVDGIYYNINMTERTLSVTWGNTKYTGDIIIPSTVFYANQDIPVTNIGHDAFNSSNITSIEIPNSVTEIGENAFRGCSSLASVDIPNSITEIGENAFRDCKSLTKVEISDLVAWCKINFSDFYTNPLFYANHLYLNGSEITELVIPDAVTSILNYTFCGCTGLTSVVIHDAVTSILNFAFDGCTGLTSVIIPNSVTFIGWGTFKGCSNLASIEIPNSVTEIEGFTFKDCSSLTSIEIPNSVTKIGQHTFNGCSSLTSIEIPNSVTEIDGSTFKDCSSLTSVDIPNSVKYISVCAFEGCSSLASIDIPNSVTYIGDWAFKGCSSLVSVEIPNSVTKIAWYTFESCSSLASVEIPNSVKEIGNAAFRGCSSLASVEIPNSVKEIGINVFNDCSSLKRLIFEDGMDPLNWGFETGNEMLFFQDSPLEEVYLGRNFQYIYSPFKYNTTIKILSLGKFTIDAMSISPQQNEGLEVINCYNPVPPEINKFTTAQYLSIIVNIPFDSLERYKDHPVWSLFWNLEESGVKSLLANPDARISIYTMNGMVVKKDCRPDDLNSLPKGIYIVVSGKERYKISI